MINQVKRLLGSCFNKLPWKTLWKHRGGNLLRPLWESLQRFLRNIRKRFPFLSYKAKQKDRIKQEECSSAPTPLDTDKGDKKDVDTTLTVISSASNHQIASGPTSFLKRLAQSSTPLLTALGLFSPNVPVLTRQCDTTLNWNHVAETFEKTYNYRNCTASINFDNNTLINTPVANPLISLALTDLPGTVNFTNAKGNGNTRASDGTMGGNLGIHGGYFSLDAEPTAAVTSLDFILNDVTPIFDITYNTNYSDLNSFSDTISTDNNANNINLDDNTLANTPVVNSLISLAFTDLPGTISFTNATGNDSTSAGDGTRDDNLRLQAETVSRDAAPTAAVTSLDFILNDVTPIFDITYNTDYSDLNRFSDTISTDNNASDINLDDNTLTNTPVANSPISLAFTDLPGTISFTDVTGNSDTSARGGTRGDNLGIHGGRFSLDAEPTAAVTSLDFTLSDVTPIFDITYNMDYSNLNRLSDTIFTHNSANNINLDDNTLANTPVVNSLISLAFTDLPAAISFTDGTGNGGTGAGDGTRGGNLGLQAETVSLVAEPTAAATSLDLALNKVFTSSNWNTAQAVTVNTAEDADTANDTATITLAVNETNNGATGQSVGCAACVSNLSGGTSNVAQGGTSTWIANSFTTGGSSSDRFSLGHVIIHFRSSASSSTVQIRANNNGRPGAQIGSNLTGANLPSSGQSRFNASGITLNGATTYFLTVSIPNTPGLSSRRDDGETGAPGWSIGNGFVYSTTGVNGRWTQNTYSIRFSVNASVQDGATVATSPLSVNEGGSATYTLKLTTRPSSNVTVTVARTSGGDTDLTLSGSPLTFTTTNWNTAQTLTVSAAEDADTANGSATFTHSASSGDSSYNGSSVTISDLVANEVDNDTPGVTVTGSRWQPHRLRVNEGSSNTYTLVLTAQPSSNVTVTAARTSGGDTDLSLSGSPLTFTNANWDTAQTLTVSAAEDNTDALRGSATFAHTASSGDSRYNGSSITISELVANEWDNDQQIAPAHVTSYQPTVSNGGIQVTWDQYVPTLFAPFTNYRLHLNPLPNSGAGSYFRIFDITTTSYRMDGVASGRYEVYLTVCNAQGCSTNGGFSWTVELEAGATVTTSPLNVSEGSSATYTLALNTRPRSNVTVTITKQSGGDGDLTLSGSPLTFTNANWNTAQTLTVSAAEDDADSANGSTTFTHSASSGDSSYNGSSLTIGDLVANEVDNDTPGVTVATSPLGMNEGSSNTYTLVLDAQPSNNVTVTATRTSGGDTGLSLSGSPLTFTNANWNTVQTLTVSAAEDADAANGSATFTHSASSGDSRYDGSGVTITDLVANKVDNDTAGVTVATSPLSVNEGSSNTYTLVLTAQPSSNVTVTAVRKSGGDTDLSLSGSPLTFTNANWDTAQTLTVSAAEDADAANGSTTFTHSASSGDSSYNGSSLTISDLVANEVENDTPGVTVTGSPLGVSQGSSSTYTLALDTQPSGNVTVTATRTSGGDTDLTLAGSPLTFTTTNWNTAQTLTVSAAEDADFINGSATFTHSASSGDSSYNGSSLTISNLVANEVESGICDRTTAVADALVAAIAGASTCGEVTPSQVAGVTTLNVSNKDLTTLKVGDFNGLTALQILNLGNNRLTSLPDLSALTNLQQLQLQQNSLTSLPDLSALTNIISFIPSLNPLSNLSALTFTDGAGNAITLSPAFSGATTSYTANTDSASVRVTPTAADTGKTPPGFSGTYPLPTIKAGLRDSTLKAVTSGSASDPITLSAGTNTLDVEVSGRARAGSASGAKRYTITVKLLPAQPTVQAVPGNQQIQLSWAAQSAAESWEYQVAAGGGAFGSWTAVPMSSATTTGFTLSSLTNGTPYTIRVRAKNTAGEGPWGEATATPATVPGKPRGLRINAGNQEVHLTWDADASADDWQYRMAVGSDNFGAWQTIPMSDDTTSRHLITELEDGTTYRFQIRARNATGDGPASDVISGTPQNILPVKVTRLTAEAGDRQVLLRLPDYGRDPRYRYEYRYKVGDQGTYGSWIQVPLEVDDFRVAILVTGLTNDSKHIFQVRMLTRSVAGTPSDEVSATPFAPTASQVPGKVNVFQTFYSQPLGGVFFRLYPIALATSYEWQSARLIGVPIVDPCENNTLGPWGNAALSENGGQAGTWMAVPPGISTNLRLITGIVRGYVYCFRVRGRNAAGVGPPSDIKGNIVIDFRNNRNPDKPTLSAAAAPGQVELSWAANPWALGWQYRQTPSSGTTGWRAIPGSSKTTSSHVAQGLTDGTEYTFRVRATGSSRPSVASDPVTATPGPTFGSATVSHQTWVRNRAITALQLPEAVGGAGNLIYTLGGRLPQGVTLNGTTLQLTGKPTQTMAAKKFTWTATDKNRNSVSLEFNITVGPTFGDATISDQTWFQNTPITALQLPEAVGGAGNLIYTLGGRLPQGVTLNGTTFQLIGTPTQTMATKRFTWTARDTSQNTVTLAFNITVVGVPISNSSLNVPEGSSNTYTLMLGAQPTANVTVTIVRKSGDTDLTVADTDPVTSGVQNTLAFTDTNWNTAQTVTIKAAEDDGDSVDGSATFGHSASSGDSRYGGSITISDLVANEVDNDTPGVTVTGSPLGVGEGSSATYTLVLNAQPGGDVTVTAARKSGGDTDLSLSGSPLTFTDANWNTAQTLTVSAAEDDGDSANGSATFEHSASSGDSSYDGSSITISELVANEVDNDTAGVTVTGSPLAVNEGSSNTYTLVLDAQPSSNVTVTAASKSGGDTDLSLSGSPLTFTNTNWNTAQTLTVSAAEDDGDSANGSATFAHSASSGDSLYNGSSVTISELVANEVDNDTAGVTVTGSPLGVNEGNSNTYTLVLTSQPSSDVTVTVSKQSGGDGDLSLSGSPLTFTNANWNTAQILTVSAAEDADAANGSATFAHSASSGDSLYNGGNVTISDLVANEAENDSAGVTVATSPLSVNEGSSATYTLVLTSEPSSDVAITVLKNVSGDPDLNADASSKFDGVTNSFSLKFTSTNWNTVQTVTVSAAEDDSDSANGSATFQHRASSGDSLYNGGNITIGDLVANEVDNDTAGVTVATSPLGVTEGSSNTYTLVLTAPPSSNVTVTASRKTGGDTDLTLAGSPLTFSNTNWNTAQTLTVSAAEDADTSNGSATFEHSASSGDSRYDGGNVTISELVANEVDNDTAGVTVTGSPLGVNEGSSNTYTLVLDAQPSSNVTVTAARTSGGDTDLSLSGSPLTFTNTNWNTAQTLTVSAAEDDGDSENGSATFEHSASSGDSRYDGASITISDLVANEVDNDTPGVTITGSPLGVNEASSNTYTLVLDAQPSSNVTVTATRKTGGDGDLSLSGSPLTFTNGNWNTAQTLTVSAAEDADAATGSATFAHSASSGDSRYNSSSVTISDLVANEVENDTPGVTVATSPLGVNEGSSNTYTLVLTARPSSDVTITVLKNVSGDPDLNADASSKFDGLPNSFSLKFTSTNWNTAQTVTVSAAEDDSDSANGSATFQHRASSGDSLYNGGNITIGDLVANEVDNDTAGVTVTGSPLAVNEGSSNTYTLVLDAQPSSNVTVTATRKTGGDGDLSLSGSPLTFTNTNWNTAQTLTVSAAEDADAATGSATFAHSASSGDSRYNGGSVTISDLVANEVDNNTAGVTVATSPLRVNEGSSNTYTLVLTAQPSSDVAITVLKKIPGDPDLNADARSKFDGLPNSFSLKFTSTNWNTAQTVTVSAAEDDGDSANGSATFQHRASSGDSLYNGGNITIGDLVANEVDNDTAGVTVTGSPLGVNEGSSNTYTLVLTAPPSSNVTVTASRKSGGDGDLSLSGSPLTFSNTNWNTAQTLTVSAAEDEGDSANGSATFTHSASSGDSRYDGSNVTISELVANEVDNDTAGVTVTGSPLAVNEASSNTYTLVLDAQPSSNVTVTASRKTGGDTDLSISGSPLTFTDTNWNTAQTLTVSAAEDEGDSANGSATFTHSASSGDSRYDGSSVTISELVANEVDNDTAGVTVTGSPLAVNEGSSNTYTLVLTAPPSSNVTVTAARKTGGDTDLSLSGSPLTFTNANWNTAQTLTVSAAEDEGDSANGSATFTHSASSGDSRYDGSGVTISDLVANEVDNDTAGVTVTGSPLAVNEASSNTYTLVLTAPPSSNVTVTASRKTGGDTDLSISGSPLTFTDTNWNTAQTLTVSAAEDDGDSANGSATFTHSASSGDSRYDGGNVTISELVANEVDNDTAGVTVTGSPLAVNEGSSNTYTLVLDAQPSSNVTVTAARKTGGDTDLSLSGSPLTFTDTNWNTAQTLTVSAAEDDGDSANGSATFTHSASSGDSRYDGASVTISELVANEVDNDTAGVTVTGSPLAVNEGSSATYTLVLTAPPSSNVTVTASRKSGGDTDLTLSGSPLTFTDTNWNTAQTLTVSAAEDDGDSATGSATFTHSASSGDSRYDGATA